MKVRSSVKPICEKCKVIKRKGSIRIICKGTRSTNRDRVNLESAELTMVFHPSPDCSDGFIWK